MDAKPYLTLSQAAKQLPGRPAAGTLWRWCRRGIQVRHSDARVRLQHVRIGGRLYTTVDWLADFGRQLAEADIEARQVAHPNRVRVPSHREAEELLQKEGL